MNIEANVSKRQLRLSAADALVLVVGEIRCEPMHPQAMDAKCG